MQNSRVGEGSKTGDKESKTISNELASAINDGLYFYEQVEKTPMEFVNYCTFTVLTYDQLAGTENQEIKS